MKALQITKINEPLEVREITLPEPGSHEVLIKLKYTGVCHTGIVQNIITDLDVHVRKGDLGEIETPLTPGHEGVGEVIKLGPKVTQLKVGDRVGVPWLAESCLECVLCKRNCENLCPYQRQSGFKRDGTFAQYVTGREEFVAKIPANLQLAETAPILCAGVTAYKALKLTAAKPGDLIVISGAGGGLGHMCVQYAKLMGYRIAALDYFTEQKIAVVCKYTDVIINLSSLGKKTTTEALVEIVGKDAYVAAAIILAPVMEAYAAAIDYTSPGGTIVAVSLPKGNFQLDLIKLILKELRLQGSIVGTPRDLEEALALMATSQVHPSIKIQPLQTANQVLEDLENGRIAGRIVLDVTQ